MPQDCDGGVAGGIGRAAGSARPEVGEPSTLVGGGRNRTAPTLGAMKERGIEESGSDGLACTAAWAGAGCAAAGSADASWAVAA